jgi:MFS transporter, SP family, inositol transporter
VGALAALGPNAIGAAVGSVFGARLGDRLGRKRIYQYDLLVYAAGALLIALAVNPLMLFAGTVVVGVAVGADVPTSLALVGEFSPRRARGKLMGLTQVAWNLGPLVVLLLAFVLAPLGLLGIRIVFAHLVLVALVTWALRRGMSESLLWKSASEKAGAAKLAVVSLLRHPYQRGMVWTATIYVFWNLAAGTAGIFTPYMVKTLGAGGQATSVGLSGAGFLIGGIATLTLFMRFSDRSFGTRKLMWGIGAVMQVCAYLLFLVLPFTVPVIVMNILLFGVGQALAGEAFYKVFSQDLFPTLLRGTAQGLTFGLARVVLGFWSFFVPVLAETGIRQIAALLAAFLVVSGLVGLAFMPDTVGRSLEDTEEARVGQRT